MPLLILGGAAFLSAVFAILAILPATHYRGVGPDNLLFFGSFTQLGEAEWTERVFERLQGDEAIYRTMLHDLYQNGIVLERKKYRMLGWAYRIFLVGLTASLGLCLRLLSPKGEDFRAATACEGRRGALRGCSPGPEGGEAGAASADRLCPRPAGGRRRDVSAVPRASTVPP